LIGSENLRESFGTWAEEKVICLAIAGAAIQIEYGDFASVVCDLVCITGSRIYLFNRKAHQNRDQVVECFRYDVP
jgi:hypothetical protein